ncbi:ATPase [Sulfobacillus harzensis]|uniref:ATPase n=1 Tax=Sulfobacillus harzensis TaxID=2729629 RepID=A0A7Y0L4C5_9FIRM|nr:ATPase [Sulfobacillus harzensis]NMP22990.1 ATPase [Sulfobacillus harzensis]
MEQELIISEVARLLDKLEELLQDGRRLPWGRQVMVDADAMRTVIQHLRHALPEEVRQAQWIIQERDRIIQSAGHEADQIMSDAMQRARTLAGDAEVVREAQTRADEILRLAESRAREIHQGALAYADEILAQVERTMSRAVEEVRRDRGALNPEQAANS